MKLKVMKMDNIIQDKYTRIDGESTYHYELRCYNQKFQDDDISWYNLATIMNRELGESHWESQRNFLSWMKLTRYIRMNKTNIQKLFLS